MADEGSGSGTRAGAVCERKLAVYCVLFTALTRLTATRYSCDLNDMDRRTKARIKLHLAAKCSVHKAGSQSFSALTVNISRSGILLQRRRTVNGLYRSGPAVEIGDIMQVEINLPAIDSLQPRCLCITGHVTRADNEFSGENYIAVTVQTMQFLDVHGGDTPKLTDRPAFVM